ncbi:hypothetical protein GO988_15540 [Hymenobacter sp. HMF4947]|uniref:LPXTG cell wall anchor domain-containing protein n=1 Tax=Hymenobacter ginkgonis TaxID=2682976 RepID=A0A7K1THH2_9BACT|nr:hypothetical protein [Hymenobacter ginkgonis]MVN77746.1 hypothetical protein [Hymenobacter ginkgonis]
MRYIFLLISILLLNGCALLEAGQAWHPPLVLPVVTDSDSTGVPGTTMIVVAKNFYAGTYKDRSDRRAAGGGTFVAKANAPVATGTSQAQDFTRAGQQGGALSTAPGSTAGATTRTGVPPWALVAAGVVLLLLLVVGLVLYFRKRLPTIL